MSLDSALLSTEQIVESQLFVGDGGNADTATLQLLREEAQKYPERTQIIFLGDNVYPRGIPMLESSKFVEAKSRLQRQMEVVQESHVKAFFLPGNHDWDFSGADGWQAIRREENLVKSVLGKESFWPGGGCPGPVAVHSSMSYRFIVMDSQWWLHNFSKPKDVSSSCETYDEQTILSRLRSLLDSPESGKQDILLMHHPLMSYGQHTFAARCPDDTGCPAYQKMLKVLSDTLRHKPPFLCAAGHDHSLQLIRGGSTTNSACQNFLVSGASSNVTSVKPKGESLFAFSELGFCRLDTLKNGDIALTVIRTHDQQRDTFWLRKSVASN